MNQFMPAQSQYSRMTLIDNPDKYAITTLKNHDDNIIVVPTENNPFHLKRIRSGHIEVSLLDKKYDSVSKAWTKQIKGVQEHHVIRDVILNATIDIDLPNE